MTDTNFTFISLEDSMYETPYLDDDIDDGILEWHSIEGAERIKELSRQLRTFLNYKTSMIYLRFSRSQNCDPFHNRNMIIEKERELNMLTSHLLANLKEIGVDDGDNIGEKIQNLFDKIKTLPNEIDINRLKDIKSINKKIWELIHILSELEIHHHSRLFNRITNIACISCEIQSIMFHPFSEFYYELKSNYLLLVKEISGFLRINDKNKSPSIKNKNRERVLS